MPTDGHCMSLATSGGVVLQLWPTCTFLVMDT